MRFGKFGWVIALAATSTWAFAQSDIFGRQQDAMNQLRAVQGDVRFLFNGSQIERVYGPPFAGGMDSAEAAGSFVKDYADLFLVGDGEFVSAGAQSISNGKFTAYYFNEFVSGVRVDNGYLTILARAGLASPIVLASAHSQTVSADLPKVRISAKQAMKQLVLMDSSFTRFGHPELVVWLGESTQHLAWKFDASGKSYGSDVSIKVWIDAATGQILNLENNILSVDVTGSAKGWASPGLNPDFPAYAEVLTGLPHLRVSITGGSSAYADANGNFTIPNAGSVPVTVTSGLVGRYATVVPSQGVALSSSNSVTPPGPVSIVYAAGLAEFDVGQVNAYIHAHRVHDFVKAMSPSYPGVDISLTTTVNQASTCNANFNSGTMSINFFAAGGGCPNTGYSTVVYHEYGHFVINRAGTGQGGFGEGMGDTIAALLGDTPNLGWDFLGFGTGPLRSAINSIHYPENAGSEIHTAGMIVSGAYWETVRKMDTTIGHAAGLALMRNYAVNSILLHPPGITPGLTVDCLTLDDNDANLNNGTPHYDDIAYGFGLKGLTAPPLVYVTIAPVAVPGAYFVYNPNQDLAIQFRVQVTASITNPNLATARLFTRQNGGSWSSSPMIEYADPGFMAGFLDQPACGTTVDWYISVQDDQGHTVFYPSGGASAPSSFLVASALQTLFTDTFETANPWSITNTALSSGAWVRGDPIGTTNSGTPSQPENDSSDTGANCYFTGQGAVGGSVGSADVDGGPTELKSPVFDLSGGDALIEYSRWFYSVNGTPDVFTVQISNNGGASWTTMETVTGTANNSWIRKSLRVGQFVTPTANVQVRFLATDNPNNSLTEAAIDNVVVKRIVCN